MQVRFRALRALRPLALPEGVQHYGLLGVARRVRTQGRNREPLHDAIHVLRRGARVLCQRGLLGQDQHCAREVELYHSSACRCVQR